MNLTDQEKVILNAMKERAGNINQDRPKDRPNDNNVNQQILDALTILTTPKMVVEDPNKLRDQFAMAALTGILAGSPNSEIGPEDYAHDAYMFADAMIEARGKK